ncbi:MAG: hypothetical protein ABII64_08300 [Elusimicrobiota bacterium]
MKRNDRGFSLIIILFAMVIIAALYLAFMKANFKKPALVDSRTQKALAGQGADATSYPAMVKEAENAAAKADALIKKQEKMMQEASNDGI